MKRKIVFSIYKRTSGYYWRVKSSNGNVIADGAEGYKARVSCRRSLASFIDHIQVGAYEIEDGRK